MHDDGPIKLSASPPEVNAHVRSPGMPGTARSPRLLSAICPGLGQIACGRRASGLLQMGVCFAGLLSAVIMLIGQSILVYRTAVAPGGDPQQDLSTLLGADFVLPFASCLAVALFAAVWSVWDAGKES